MVGKIDVHTHALPDFFHDILLSLGREAAGVPMIQWSMEGTKDMMSKLDISTSILSLSAPGPEVIPETEGARALARRYNEWACETSNADPSRFGFFAALPGLHDIEGCIAEIRYAFDSLHADGVCLFTSYGGKYLGDPTFVPIWEELNGRSAVVFIHPTIAQGSTLASPMLQPPAFDFAHETGRTAAHLIVTGMKRRFPKAKIILSHAGGTLPLLSERLAQLEVNLFLDTLDSQSPKSSAEILADAKSFYFDLALAGTTNVLDLLLNWAPRTHILYGSDYPYATVEAEYNTGKLEEYPIPAKQRENYYAENGLDLFPRLRR
ncbi:hypothetical protein LTR91_023983 [Friedmanniomyces endolithicus]|uniref:6-methylsalicylate decarboxylase n=1 Tax=Friedmanniomyces endolithicus TaxID=329885 RepID=A0AAN6K3P4_9PEZI|nr:hypothetical protein LTR57_024248 [Friedmanniomyces endolithicus]KAK0953181.1 hypothetical protein LTR91_023983 [Friedmanniomyces endolithicus]KAK0953513.1 hypothetical protein LTS01_024342 [Friedmanniomyces endolithicus]KAK1022550.1 hypothetical protein LTS16_025628 [Friedmanniomyces endolithicus]